MLPFEHLIIIDKDRPIPIYQQIAFSITDAIRHGWLKAGTRLPGSRELAKILGVHRKTVIAAYEELDAQDWVKIVPRKHITVSDHIPSLRPQKWTPDAAHLSYSHDFRLPFRSVHDAPLPEDTGTHPFIIDDGHPDVRLSPIDTLLKTYRSFTSRRTAIKSAHTGTSQGTIVLRKALTQYLSETRGLNISEDNLLITHGAQMSIYLTARLLLDSKASIITGRPGYPAANKAFEEAGATIIEVPVDDQGIDTRIIEQVCQKKKVAAVYVIPHHHYPSTVTLSVERRMKLLELSQQYSFAIIEDDYDYDYHYTSSPYLPLASGRHNGTVIYIGSFSKVLDPSLRMGFMVAPANLIAQCVALRQCIDAGGDGYMQNALAELIKDGELNRHLKKAKKIYHHRRDFLHTLLQEKLENHISYTLPSGGMAVWIKVRPEYPVSHWQNHRQIRFLRLDAEENAFRFGFASMNEKELEEIVELLSIGFSQISAGEY